jgi:Pyruvate/2-oxoacid:ferredoxin oxidoreductase delta subunit
MEEVDVIVSVAKMKTHQLMYATGSVKNLFGMVPGLHKSACHMRYPTREAFARMLAGLYSVIAPQFAVMDAIVSMEGHGPAAGKPRHTGLLLASNDPTALDFAQALIMGYEPFTVPLVKELHDRHLTWWNTPDDIGYPLLDANTLVVADYERIKQEPKTRLLSSLFGPIVGRALGTRRQQREPKPLFDDEKCIRCGKCVRICPGKALSLDKDDGIVADYKLCIRCYCCHEVCPADAITIETKEGSA